MKLRMVLSGVLAAAMIFSVGAVMAFAADNNADAQSYVTASDELSAMSVRHSHGRHKRPSKHHTKHNSYYCTRSSCTICNR